MRANKKIKIKYIYNKPRTLEEKEHQREMLASAYNILFESAYKRLAKQHDNTKS